ncbi:MAG: S41 family peptidase [Phycisphaerales bacterium]|jgi:tricorn protease
MRRLSVLVFVCGLSVGTCGVFGQAKDAPGHLGFYRHPSLWGDVIVFEAEEDLWKVSVKGGVATRLTTHPGQEFAPAISPDGTMVAFCAQYEGPVDVYVMPLAGGLPKRLTFEGARRTNVVGWKPAAGGKPAMVMAATDALSTLPDSQLTLIDPTSGVRTVVPLSQAAQGAYEDTGKTLFFTRLAFQGSQTKRYKGGSVQTLWKFADGDAEATPMSADFAGTSANAMWWDGRVYFQTDRDGTMEIYSMKPDGADVQQQTNHTREETRLLDVRGASADASRQSGRFVYQMGADIWVYNASSKADAKIDIRLESDFDQTREKWIKKPFDYLSSAAISPDGSKAVLTVRGQVFTVPKDAGRLAEVSREEGVRYRNATWMPDGKSLLALSDESGEVELWTLPPNGVGTPTQLTTDGTILRWEAVPSPDGKKIAHHDKNQKLWLFDVATKTDTNIDTNGMDNFSGLGWSPDSRWLSYIAYANNQNRQVKIFDTQTSTITFATTDRFDTSDATWSPDGKWLYILSDRNIKTLVTSPWGAMQPEPFFDQRTMAYAIALKKGERSPWIPGDEVYDAKKEQEKKDKEKKEKEKPDPDKKEADKAADAKDAQPAKDADPAKKDDDKSDKDAKDDTKKEAPKPVEIDLGGLETRLNEVPVDPGNYFGLSMNDKRLFFLSKDSDPDAKTMLLAVDIANKDVEAKTLVKDLEGYDLSRDGKAILVRRKDSLAIIDAASGPNADLSKATLPLGGWTFPLTPREEWRQMFTDAWRLERDYFYDTNMHGVDWKAMKARYLPLVDRVSCRGELSDVLAQMVGELSALHIFVYGGDMRDVPDRISLAGLGAVLEKTDNGFVVTKIFPSDPDVPDLTAPLARPEVDVHEGDVITMVNGREAGTIEDMGNALRTLAGKQVLLHVKEKAGGERDVIVTPWNMGNEANLRYHAWEYTRRLQVEDAGKGELGYVHLRAMGGDNMDEFAKGYYPVFNRKGLIIDVRHNRGGNIDSWILNRLIRKAWFYWQARVGDPTWNMQQAFRGHIVVLCDELTASDGEAFSEGIKRLKIGPVIGTRTWGGEIWLSSSNRLVDGGIATAAEIGVYGLQGDWLIEGHGVDPDVVVENLPHATFKGQDAQLEAAIRYLQKEISEHPVDVPPAPKHPIKSFRGAGGNATDAK